MGVLGFDPRKCLNHFESVLAETTESAAEFSIKKAEEVGMEKPVNMTDREKSIYWMGVNQGLQMAQQLVQSSKEFAELYKGGVKKETNGLKT